MSNTDPLADTEAEYQVTPERVAIHAPHAERAHIARRLLATPLAQEDPYLVRTTGDGFEVPGELFDQAFPEPEEDRPAERSPAHPAGKARKGKAAEGKPSEGEAGQP